MSLNHIAACFLPYGFERQGDGKWVAFNREYHPLFVAVEANLKTSVEKVAALLPPERVRREAGKITCIWLYVSLDKKSFAAYAKLLSMLSFTATKVRDGGHSTCHQTPPKEGHYSSLKWDRREFKTEAPKAPPLLSDGSLDIGTIGSPLSLYLPV